MMTINELGEQLETVSAAYADKFGLQRDSDWFMLKLHEEIGELTSCYVELVGGSRPRGRTEQETRENLGEELADVVAHAILLGRHLGVDLDEAIRTKWLEWL